MKKLLSYLSGLLLIAMLNLTVAFAQSVGGGQSNHWSSY